MNWWRALTEDGPDGSTLGMILLVALFLAMTVIPLVLIAVGMSFLWPGQRWAAVLAVLTGWPVQVRLLWAVLGVRWTFSVFAICIGTAAAWVMSAFALGQLFGPLLAVAVMVVASPNAVWTIGRLEDWNDGRR